MQPHYLQSQPHRIFALFHHLYCSYSFVFLSSFINNYIYITNAVSNEAGNYLMYLQIIALHGIETSLILLLG